MDLDQAIKQCAETLPPIDELLPHRGTMKLLDSVISFDRLSVCVSAQVNSDAWYADDDGAMPNWIGIELMAQAIGVHVSLLTGCEGGVARPGVLLGTQQYEASVNAFAAHTRLHINAKQVLRSAAGHGAYDCAISNDAGACLAHAIVKVYQPDDFRAFMQGV
ncbi:3-hydroxydecanoyl-[ACP] dehydratase [Candidatus Burkholderia verschuerenii]|uniref:3-hydroxydecanoyl-[ACP] dehydratase n=1 Tax=Candidatus Burkholderia verschuerenii TaxID=242163 RepID=A0A0L0MI04_9BURK|nr:beta-hydroxyacyl-ACP dehydratase [Candidatus Burkholderia verschuerenii]KND61948.1 3-hydroxydecanoyl-[ACP] dehydratase [Candidatus Burkholderia verschuerenii]